MILRSHGAARCVLPPRGKDEDLPEMRRGVPFGAPYAITAATGGAASWNGVVTEVEVGDRRAGP
jgi:hypothetical protein